MSREIGRFGRRSVARVDEPVPVRGRFQLVARRSLQIDHGPCTTLRICETVVNPGVRYAARAPRRGRCHVPTVDMGMVFDALLPTTPVTLEAMGERIAGIPRCVQGDRLASRVSEIEVPPALARLAETCGGPRVAWQRVLNMRPSAWAEEWVIDESPVWGELLVEDGELRMARLRELDRWLMDEVLGGTAEAPSN